MSKRATVTLSSQDMELLDAVADPDRPEGESLRAIAGELGIELRGRSESALLRVLIATGAAAVQERALERGYQELSEIYPDVHDAPEAAERRRRYAERVDTNMEA